VKALSGAWCAWVAENVAEGVATTALVDVLVDHGVPRALARDTVRAIASSPAMHAVIALRDRVRRRDLYGRLLGELRGPVTVERRKKPRAAEFFARYWANNEPVVFTDAAKGWRLWTPEDMKREVGDVVVRVTEGREGDPRYDENFRKHLRKTTVARFVDRVLAAGETNDFYLVANGKAMDQPGMERLLRRVVVDPEYFDPEALRGGTSLWLGPKGTVTPLHHDTTNILFFQIHGRKELLLAPPHEPTLTDRARGFYVDDPGGASFARVVLEPGEALFLPAGWWHRVQSLDVSISFSLLAFRRPNRFTWYRPGVPEGRTRAISRRARARG
jgi:hypothetical protein